MLVPIDTLPSSARVWVYQSAEMFDDETAAGILNAASDFADQWTAHDASLKAGVEVRHNLFLIFAVDESHNDASGCSLDKKVRFVKQIESTYGLNFFDRMRIAFRNSEGVKSESFARFGDLLRKGEVNDRTFVFNNLITDLKQLRENWEVPLELSWHKNILQTA
jgi:hypothetical protein